MPKSIFSPLNTICDGQVKIYKNRESQWIQNKKCQKNYSFYQKKGLFYWGSIHYAVKHRQMNKFINTIYSFLKSVDQEAVLSTPTNMTVRFELKFKNLSIGTLTLHEGTWSFVYSDEFKTQSKINPITDFPDKEKEYQSDTLFPFFAFRIPSLQRLKIQKIIPADQSKNEVLLLKEFGKQSIVNPYQLLPTQ